MTNSDYTAIGVLFDRSGSMQSLRGEAESSLNVFVREQAFLTGHCTVKLAEFDHLYNEVFPSTPAMDAPTYILEPRGMTALYDAIGRFMVDFGAELAGMPEESRPGNVIVVIVTDGLENASREWTAARVRTLIEEQQSLYSWRVIFMGANQDAVLTAQMFGIPMGSALTYASPRAAMGALSTYASNVRKGRDAEFTKADRKDAL